MKITGVKKVDKTAGIRSQRTPVIDRAPLSYGEDQGRKPPTGKWRVWMFGRIVAEFTELEAAKNHARLLES